MHDYSVTPQKWLSMLWPMIDGWADFDGAEIHYNDWRESFDDIIDADLLPWITARLPHLETGAVPTTDMHNGILLLALLVSERLDRVLCALTLPGVTIPLDTDAALILERVYHATANYRGMAGCEYPAVQEIPDGETPDDWRINLGIHPEMHLKDVLAQVREIFTRRQAEWFVELRQAAAWDGASLEPLEAMQKRLNAGRHDLANRWSQFVDYLRTCDHRRRHPECTWESFGSLPWWPTRDSKGEQKQKAETYHERGEEIIEHAICKGEIWSHRPLWNKK